MPLEDRELLSGIREGVDAETSSAARDRVRVRPDGEERHVAQVEEAGEPHTTFSPNASNAAMPTFTAIASQYRQRHRA